MMLRRLLRIIILTLFWIVSLAGVLLMAVLVYHHTTSLNPAAFLSENTRLVYSGDNLGQHPWKGSMTVPEVADHIRPLVNFKAAIHTVFVRQPVLMRKFSPVFSSAFHFSITEDSNPLMVFDLGWRSFLFSASSFVIRTTWSSEPDILFATRELTIGGEDITIYSVTLPSRKINLYIALKKNILILSSVEETLRKAVAAQLSGKNLLGNRAFRMAGSGQSGSLRTGGIPGWLATLLSHLQIPKSAWTGMTLHSGRLQGITVTDPEQGIRPERLLHSNTYRVGDFPFLTAALTWKGKALLFDALEEVVRPIGNPQWRDSGNEAGIFRLPRGTILYCRLLGSRAAARTAARASGARTPGAGEVVRIKSSPLLASLAAFFGIPAPKYLTHKNALLFGAPSSHLLQHFLDRTADTTSRLPFPGMANTLYAEPAAKRLTRIRHSNGTIRFERLTMPRATHTKQ